MKKNIFMSQTKG